MNKIARGGREWPVLSRTRNLFIFIFYLLLFVGCIVLIRPFDFGYYPPANARLQYKEANKITSKMTTPNSTTKTDIIITPQNRTEFPLICLATSPNTSQTKCAKNYPKSPTQHDQIIPSLEWCPHYFKWIHEDLKPWKSNGITKEMIEAGKKLAYFRLVIIDGRVYVETYKKSFQTRDVFTIWGILQLLRFYPGIMLPDLDLIFECDDKPVIKKRDYAAISVGGERINWTNNYGPPPMFHYCGDDASYDIPFPDWSFWGWHEINIKPWESMMKDLKEGNQRVKWVDRAPYAYWKGNIRMGRRGLLLSCNSTQQWNAEIYAQRWKLESRHGFRHSSVADQCTHRYKIYMEGKSWSVSEKYIQACDSMLLLVQPRYYEFFTRSLVPLKHYWPINPRKLCESIKFAVDWGNHHPQKAQEIGKTGSKFIMEELKMKYIYDYMFHLLKEYGKLLKYKPTVPPRAIEVCLETMACDAQGKEKQWKIESMIKTPSQTGPCNMPSYDPHSSAS